MFGRIPWLGLLRNPSVAFGGFVLVVLVIMAAAAPLVAPGDPTAFTPRLRLKPPSDEFWFGTDRYGRDIWRRVVHGAQVSLAVGLIVAALSLVVGTVIGLIAGYVRVLDGVLMRLMDGLMAIPGILLAIALVSVSGASLTSVIVAIFVPEIPRVARMARSVVLSIREEPFIEAAIGLGTPTPVIMLRHILPNTLAPLIVQGTYIAASAILT
ncbi:MAG: ABC transporter permease, partial [Alphaproteobacteria bacterium]